MWVGDTDRLVQYQSTGPMHCRYPAVFGFLFASVHRVFEHAKGRPRFSYEEAVWLLTMAPRMRASVHHALLPAMPSPLARIAPLAQPRPMSLSRCRPRSVRAASELEVTREEFMDWWRKAVQDVALLAHQARIDLEAREILQRVSHAAC
jgi:hypothetical protein